MTAHKVTYIYCDGGREECPTDCPYAEGDAQGLASEQRRDYVADGWVFRNGKDYCPDCAKRLGLSRP